MPEGAATTADAAAVDTVNTDDVDAGTDDGDAADS